MNDVTVGAKRAFGIGDPLLLERRASDLAAGVRHPARGARPRPAQLAARRAGDARSRRGRRARRRDGGGRVRGARPVTHRRPIRARKVGKNCVRLHKSGYESWEIFNRFATLATCSSASSPSDLIDEILRFWPGPTQDCNR